MKMTDLDKESRLRLMRFVCSFAWADLEIQDQERTLIGQLVAKMAMDDEEKAAVDGWLTLPPRPEEVDPLEIPREHRQLVLSTALALIGADGVVESHEMESLSLLEQILREAEADEEDEEDEE